MRRWIVCIAMLICLLFPAHAWAVTATAPIATPAKLAIDMPVPVNSILIAAPVGLTEMRTAAFALYCAEDAVLDDTVLIYTSLTPEICTVEQDGTVTALQEGVGKVEITSALDLYAIQDEKQTELGAPAKALVFELDIGAMQVYHRVIISATNAQMYTSPDHTSEYFTTMKHGDLLEYTGTPTVTGGFLTVLYNGRTAYVHMSSVSFAVERQVASVKTPLVMTVAIKSGRLNVRNAPSGTVVGRLKNGATISIIDNSDMNWYLLDNGYYVAAAYVVYMIP